MLIYTLLLTQNQKCIKCFSLSTHILLGKENEFLGFYCQQHGEEVHKRLEEKYEFESTHYKPKLRTVRKLIRRKR